MGIHGLAVRFRNFLRGSWFRIPPSAPSKSHFQGFGALKNRPARNLSDWPCSGRSRGQVGSLLGPADGVYSSAGEALLRSEYQGDGIWGRLMRHRRWRCGRADGCRRSWPWCRAKYPG
ncbi:predicted protein [Coccidioides posadasii str. Silveira]|uniref:Predicted protein n=1 Tax=Coccidioides posadasii (strain RMSCC 757 / Silveira) TaxID=443226 RepID=E9CWS4_COCPS|nr:predicted protein [Coccidioides posadasii str. Silveira]